MADELRFAEFTKKSLNLGGVIAALKSPGVVSLVTEHAERLRDAANSAAREHLTAEDLHVREGGGEPAADLRLGVHASHVAPPISG